MFARLCSMLPPRSLAEMAAATSVHVVAIIEPIIQHADWFFPEGRCLGSPSILDWLSGVNQSQPIKNLLFWSCFLNMIKITNRITSQNRSS